MLALAVANQEKVILAALTIGPVPVCSTVDAVASMAGQIVQVLIKEAL